jgi:hypothetical protein
VLRMALTQAQQICDRYCNQVQVRRSLRYDLHIRVLDLTERSPVETTSNMANGARNSIALPFRNSQARLPRSRPIEVRGITCFPIR